jgi:hypothetical protein
MRGKGCSWSRVRNGCEVRFYGWANESEHAIALAAAEEVRLAVLEAESAATIRVYDSSAQRVGGVTVLVQVTSDAVAAFENGPTHRDAVGRAISAASRSMDGAWSAIRLATASALPGGET